MSAEFKTSSRREGVILVRVSTLERTRIKKRASWYALSVSEYVRSCALNEPLTARVDVDALAELRRQGGLIKHLASTDRSQAYQYRVALNLIHDAVRRLIRDSEGSKKKA